MNGAAKHEAVEMLNADLAAEQAKVAHARAEVVRLDGKVAELEDLTRRQALFIAKLVMESRGHSFAAEVTQLRAAVREAVEIAYRRGRNEFPPADFERLEALWKLVG